MVLNIINNKSILNFCLNNVRINDCSINAGYTAAET